jgi:hypothetical protein
MPIDASTRITLRGSGEALRALQGVTRSTRAVSKEAQQAAKETERWQRLAIRSHNERIRADERAAKSAQRAAAQEARAREKAALDGQRASERAAKAIERLQQRQAQQAERLAKRTADASIREAARATNAAQREAAKQAKLAEETAAKQAKSRQDALRRAGGFVSATTAGALAGTLAAVNIARSTTGSKSASERVQAANDFRERLVRVTNDAGMTGDQREAVQAKVIAASRSTGMGIDELQGVLEAGQGQFNNLPFFADQLENIGRIAKAGGADAKDLAMAIGFANQAFELTGKAAEESGYLMKGAANVGAIELSDLASSFAPVASAYAETTKHKGERGYHEFLGLAETMGTSGYLGEEGATRVKSVLAATSSVDTQKKLAAIGVKGWVGKDGSLDIPSLVRQLATNKKWESAAVRQDIFGDIRGQQGIEALVAARRRTKNGVQGAIDIDTFLGMDAAGGRASVDSGMTAMQGEGWFKAQQRNADMQADTLEHLADFNGQLELVSAAADRLEKHFGSLALWTPSLAAAGAGSVGTAVVGKLLGGSAAGAAGGAAGAGVIGGAGAGLLGGAGASLGGYLGGLGTAVGTAGAAAAAGTIGAGLAIGGSVGLAANYGTGLVRDDGKALSDLIVDALLERVRSDQLSAGGTRNADGTLVAEMRAQTRKLESIDQGLRAASAKPGEGPRREPR